MVSEATQVRRRTSSFGSKLKAKRRRPSHQAQNPTYLDPVVEVSAKKKIIRRASTGGYTSSPSPSDLSTGGGARADKSAAPEQTQETQEGLLVWYTV